MTLNDPFVITISREIGSGGGSVGRKLAAKLNVHYSDKQLIQELEKRLNLTREGIEHLKKKKKHWLTDLLEEVAPIPKASVTVDGHTYTREFPETVNVQDVYEAEKEILSAIAEEGSCVIIGRSAFFVLKDRPNKVDIFITAPKEKRVERIMAKQGISREEAEKICDEVDKGRDNYVKRFTGLSRDDARSYNLVIDMANLTEDEAVEKILAFIGRA